MVRYLIAAATAVVMTSSFAMAETMVTDTGSTKVITRSAPDGLGHRTAIVKHKMDSSGNLVTKKKIVREGLYGRTVTRVHKTTDPMTGSSTIRRSTEMR